MGFKSRSPVNRVVADLDDHSVPGDLGRLDFAYALMVELG